MDRLNICDYWGCEETIEPDEANLKTGMRFCKKHQEEITHLINTGNVRGILSFWVTASGGAKKMTHTPTGIYQSHELANKKEE
jgi:hypothetical protein